MNPRNSACNEASLVKGVCVSQLRSKTASPSQILKSTPDRRLTMAFGFHEFSRQELYGTNMYKKYFGMIKNNFSQVIFYNLMLAQKHIGRYLYYYLLVKTLKLLSSMSVSSQGPTDGV